MSALKLLMIGGTGNISSAVTRRAVRAGMDVTILNRGHSTARPAVEGVRRIIADISDADALQKAIGDETYDCVVNWIAFTPEDIDRDIQLFRHRTKQYIFISSASAYQTPPGSFPTLESTPLRNPFWLYSRNKIAAEDRLLHAYRADGFPMTIVRPSHTYDETMVPFDGGWTVVERMRQGREVVVHGDGTSLWTLTHSDDFATGFNGLIGRDEALGNSYHITSEQPLTWNFIYQTMANAAGVDGRFVHVTSDAINATDPVWGAALLGDKAHSMVFDNAKIRALVPEFAITVPFERGARDIVAWHDADETRKIIDRDLDATMDLLVEAYRPRMLSRRESSARVS